MFTTLLPSRIVTNNREVDDKSERTAATAGPRSTSSPASMSCARRRRRAVSLLEKNADAIRHAIKITTYVTIKSGTPGGIVSAHPAVPRGRSGGKAGCDATWLDGPGGRGRRAERWRAGKVDRETARRALGRCSASLSERLSRAPSASKIPTCESPAGRHGSRGHQGSSKPRRASSCRSALPGSRIRRRATTPGRSQRSAGTAKS